MLKYITIKWLEEFKPQLMEMSNMDEKIVQKIFGGNLETLIEEDYNSIHLLKNQDVLSAKMVFRFRNGGGSPFQLCKGCDPGNQQRVLSHYNIILRSVEERDLIEFFGWIRCGLGIVDLMELQDLKNISDVYSTDMCKLFGENEIKFFFGISLEYQLKLINRYNKECVDTYNLYIKNDYNNFEIDTFNY